MAKKKKVSNRPLTPPGAKALPEVPRASASLGPRSSTPSDQPSADGARASASPGPRSSGTRFVIPVLLLIGLLAAAATAYWFFNRPREVTEADLRPPSVIGGVNACRGTPKFVRAQGFGNNVVLDTSESVTNGPGAVAFEPAPQGSNAQPRIYKHPSWDDAGYLGPIVRDADGNLYVIPVPRISNWENPLEAQNRVYRIDSTTAEMSKWLDLPVEAQPSASNPYGALGLTFDCESKSLYVAGISGSSRNAELGRVYRVDIAANPPRITSILDGVDAFGLVPFNGSKTKRLYFASARNGGVSSIALAPNGDFVGLPRAEFSVAGLFGDGDDRIRRMDIAANNNELQLRGIEFDYNLVPAREKVESIYTYRYDRGADKWVFVDAQSASKAVR